jgi:hypothetical protein
MLAKMMSNPVSFLAVSVFVVPAMVLCALRFTDGHGRGVLYGMGGACPIC